MRYRVSLLLLLICSCKENKQITIADIETFSEADIRISKNDPTLSVKNDRFFLKGIIFKGYLYQLYPNQKDTFSIECYRDGLLNGIVKKYYPGKQLMECRSYVQGAKNGKQVSYWENGNRRFEFTAKNDAYEGELKEWSENGSVFHLAHFKNGQEEGEQKLWYDDGKIKANYVIMNGRRYGLLGTKNCTNVSDSIPVIK